MIFFLNCLGHGRALEFFLGFFKVVLAGYIITSNISMLVPALADFSWLYSSVIIASPFALIGLLQLSGTILNIRGATWSWILRFFGAIFALFVWSALIIKTMYLGEPSLLAPMAISCLPASSFLIYKAWNRLPIPGVPGLR